MMKYILIFFISFFSLAFGLFDPDPPKENCECIDCAGHVRHRYLYSLRDTSENLVYSFDTTFQGRRDELDSTYRDTIEWLIIPDGWDTLVWICARCDSVQKDPSDTIRQIVRIMREVKPEERPGDWDYEGVMTVGAGGGFIGYFNDCGSPQYGSITPEYYFNDNCESAIDWISSQELRVTSEYAVEIESIEIDGILYETITDYSINGTTWFDCDSNPFPYAGQTCTIKVKLAE